MRIIGLDDIRSGLDTVINSRVCVEAYLGYAELLFLGFDDRMRAAGDEYRPPYLLSTDFADWRIEAQDKVIATADDERTKAEQAAGLLVGHKAMGWQFIDPPLSLEVLFDKGLKVKITPMADAEESVFHKVGWGFRMPDGFYRQVKWDGTMYMLHKDEPASLEP